MYRNESLGSFGPICQGDCIRSTRKKIEVLALSAEITRFLVYLRPIYPGSTVLRAVGEFACGVNCGQESVA